MIGTIITSRGEIFLDLEKFVSGNFDGWMNPKESFPYQSDLVIVSIYNGLDNKWIKIYDRKTSKFLGEYLINERKDSNL